MLLFWLLRLFWFWVKKKKKKKSEANDTGSARVPKMQTIFSIFLTAHSYAKSHVQEVKASKTARGQWWSRDRAWKGKHRSSDASWDESAHMGPVALAHVGSCSGQRCPWAFGTWQLLMDHRDIRSKTPRSPLGSRCPHCTCQLRFVRDT